MGKGKEADGPVFMQTHNHFTETEPHSFPTNPTKNGVELREEEARSRVHHLSDPHTSGSEFAVTVQSTTIPPIVSPHPLPSLPATNVGQNTDF